MRTKRILALLLVAAVSVASLGGVTFSVTAESSALPEPYAFFEIDQTNGAVTVMQGAYLRDQSNTVLTQQHMSQIPNGGGWGYRLSGESAGFHLGGTFLTKVPEGQDAIVAIEYYIDGEPDGDMFRMGGGSVINAWNFNAKKDKLVSRQNGLVFYTMTADKIYGKVSSANQDTHVRVFGCANGANVVYIKSMRLISPQYIQAADPGYEYYDLVKKAPVCPYYPDILTTDCYGMSTGREGTEYLYFSVNRNQAPSETENRAVYIRLYTTEGYENVNVALNQYQTYGDAGTTFNGFNGMPNYSFFVKNGVGSVYIPQACFRNSLNSLGSFRFWFTEEAKIARIEVYDVYTYCTSPHADPAVVADMHRGALREGTNIVAEGEEASLENPSVTTTYRCAFCDTHIGELSDSIIPSETVFRLPKEPTVDGVITAEEWGLQDDYLNNYSTYTVPNGAEREPLGGVWYGGWTDTAFCFAATAEYAAHREGSNALQVVLNGHVFRLALMNNGTVAATLDGELWRGKYAVSRKGNVTTYEVVIPQNLFGGTLKEDGLIAFSYAITMSNGYVYEWYGGVSHEATAVTLLGGDKTMSAVITETLTMGDVENSQTIDSTDARMTLQYSVGKVGADDLDLRVADVDGNGAVDSTDARLLLQYAVGRIATLPAGDRVTVPTGEVIEVDNRATSSNSFPPNSEQAGTPFLSLDEVKHKQAADGAAEFAYFAFLREDNELPFSVACHNSGHMLTAMLPAGVDLSAMIPSFSYYGTTVTVNGTRLISDATVLDLTEDVTLTLTSRQGTTRTMILRVETLDTGLPSIALTMSDMQAITSKQEYRTSTFYLGGGDVETPLLVTSRAKGRGNSTWGHAKKSYTVKLDQKATLLGMSRSKDWVLSANYEDRSLLRNMAATYLAQGTGQDWTPNRQPVDLWFNGEYWGTYDLAEKIEIEGDRVDIVEYEVGMKEGQYGFILEFDGHVAGGMDNCTRPLGEEIPLYYDPDTDELFMHTPVVSKWLTIKEPSYEDLIHDPAQMLYIYEYVCDALNALASGDYAQVEQYFDVQSFCEWYLVQAFMNNTDSDFYSSCYLTRDAGGRLTMGPIWDFDRSSVNCYYWNSAEDITYLFYHGSTWFPLLFRYPQARDVLVAEYERFVPRMDGLREYLKEAADAIYASQQYNFERWPLWGTVPNGPGSGGDWNEQAYEQLYAECFEAELARLNAFFIRHAARMDNFMNKLKIIGL